MFAVIFEVQPKRERREDYLGLAKDLKPELENIDGFLSNERFASTRRDGLLLSLSIWRDEKAVVRWRTLRLHHATQEKGRSEIFEDYHLRVGEITEDSQSPPNRIDLGQRFDATEIGAAKAVTISEFSPPKGAKLASRELAETLRPPKVGRSGVIDQETFESITAPGKLLLLVSWRDGDAADRWTPRIPAEGALRHRQVRIIRDYGMFDRREAPQYYPDVERKSDG